MDYLVVAAIVFIAALTQSIAGFGVALVAMPLLIGVLEPVTAAALVSLVALTTQVVLLTRFRHNINWRMLWRPAIASMMTIPLGIELLARLDGDILLTLLGLLLVTYATYSLISPRLPTIKNRRWGFIFGACSGLLSGAYNVGGPPMVIYGTMSRWKPVSFRGNLQILLMINASAVTLNHLLRGHYTSDVMSSYLVAVPVILLAALSGYYLDSHISAQTFRRIVLALLLVMGIRLLLL